MTEAVLCANRGEVANRLIDAVHRLGLRAVAVYSDADVNAPYLSKADEAIAIGPAMAAQSYLCIEKLIEAAKSSGARYVHPGYGFLSESAAFARACADAGLIFVGPSPKTLELSGDKAAARALAIEFGIPVVPGTEIKNASNFDEVAADAQKIGYPVLIKAVSGGGGIGIILVPSEDSLQKSLEQSQTRAERAFGDGRLYLEKCLTHPRHIEVQVASDGQRWITLGERECTLQRRHQKVIEESPSLLCESHPELRVALHDAAIRFAKASHLVGLGTVEFLVTPELDWYFIEQNPRLQVEHRVTECVVGLDLVVLQLQLARGEDVLPAQGVTHGHAIESRIYAEDPKRNFLPRPGKIVEFQPSNAAHTLCDTGYASPCLLTPYYDPMIAKLISWGDTREEATLRMHSALDDTVIEPLASNRAFLMAVFESEAWQTGAFDTDTLALLASR